MGACRAPGQRRRLEGEGGWVQHRENMGGRSLLVAEGEWRRVSGGIGVDVKLVVGRSGVKGTFSGRRGTEASAGHTMV